MRDISHKKRIESFQGEFVDHIAHEFRTPLTSILAYIEMLIDGEATDQESKFMFYNIVYEEAHRLAQLIDNLLNLSRLESGMATINCSPTRLKRLLETNLEVIRPQCEKNNQKLVVELDERQPTLNVDKSLFSVAVMNLLGNAAKYTPPGGTITVWTSSNEEQFQINVKDTGVGIEEQELPKIFDKFYRCDTAQDETVTDSGVGLATAQKILHAHGCDISVSSKRGEGSMFSILVPRSLINTSVGD